VVKVVAGDFLLFVFGKPSGPGDGVLVEWEKNGHQARLVCRVIGEGRGQTEGRSQVRSTSAADQRWQPSRMFVSDSITKYLCGNFVTRWRNK